MFLRIKMKPSFGIWKTHSLPSPLKTQCSDVNAVLWIRRICTSIQRRKRWLWEQVGLLATYGQLMASYGRRITAFRTIFDHPPNHSAASCVSVRIMLLCSRALTKATFCQKIWPIFLLMLVNKCIKKHNIVVCLFVFEQGRDGCVDCARMVCAICGTSWRQ